AGLPDVRSARAGHRAPDQERVGSPTGESSGACRFIPIAHAPEGDRGGYSENAPRVRGMASRLSADSPAGPRPAGRGAIARVADGGSAHEPPGGVSSGGTAHAGTIPTIVIESDSSRG